MKKKTKNSVKYMIDIYSLFITKYFFKYSDFNERNVK